MTPAFWRLFFVLTDACQAETLRQSYGARDTLTISGDRPIR